MSFRFQNRSGEYELARQVDLNRSLTAVVNEKRTAFFSVEAQEEGPSYWESGFPNRSDLLLRNSY